MAAEELQSWQPAYARGERHCVMGSRVVLGENGVPEGKAFLTWQGKACVEFLRQILPVWEQRTGLRVARIRWRNMTSRWGSCNVKTGEIHLSTRLILYPKDCIELVLLHEMCHMRHADHSAAFHAELEKWLPDAKRREQLLKSFDPRPLPPL